MKLEHPNSCCDCTGTMFCCGCKLNPSTLLIKNGGGTTIGRAEHSFRNFKCCHAVWIDVYDHAGVHKFTFEDKDCCQCGPNCICTTFVINVFDGKV
jgi:hypothetical protein